MYLNEMALYNLEELTHAGNPYLDKNLTKGFFNKLTGKKDEIQRNRDLTAAKIREFRKRRDNLNNLSNKLGANLTSKQNRNQILKMLEGFKNNPSYFVQTGFLPYRFSEKENMQTQVQPAFA